MSRLGLNKQFFITRATFFRGVLRHFFLRALILSTLREILKPAIFMVCGVEVPLSSAGGKFLRCILAGNLHNLNSFRPETLFA
jgi:hypothetical protein